MDIKVGDEVLFNGNIFVVTCIRSSKKYCELLAWDGNPLSDVLTDHIIKTGRHFPIECMLEDMCEDMRQYYGDYEWLNK